MYMCKLFAAATFSLRIKVFCSLRKTSLVHNSYRIAVLTTEVHYTNDALQSPRIWFARWDMKANLPQIARGINPERGDQGEHPCSVCCGNAAK